MKTVLFDMDGTLVDTSPLSKLRQERKWKECVQRLPDTVVYDGVRELISGIRELKIKIGIVTTSVSFYAEKLLSYHKISYDALVAYHDVRRAKPDPEGYLKAMLKLNGDPSTSIGVGDDLVDAQALSSGHILSAAAAWNKDFHPCQQWNYVLSTPIDLISVIRDIRRKEKT